MRRLTPDMINYLAPRHARMMGLFEEADVKRVADAMQKKGEFYDYALYPDQDVARLAQADFDNFRMGTPAQLDLGGDMNSFYFGGGPSLKSARREPPFVEPQQYATPLTKPARAQAKAKAQARPAPLTREQINTDPELYESVGQYIDAGELDDRYIAHRLGGMNHFVAKEEAFHDVKGRDYPYGRPGPESARDASLYQSGVNARKAGQVEGLLQEIEQLKKAALQSEVQTRANEIDEALKPRGFILENPVADTALMASLAALTGGVIGRASKGEKKEEQLANYETPWYMQPGSPYIAY